MRQLQKGAQPLLLSAAEELYFDPVIGTAWRQDGDEDDIQKKMPFSKVRPWIL